MRLRMAGRFRAWHWGVLDNSFLVTDSGIQVVKNFSHVVHGNSGNYGSKVSSIHSTLKRAILVRAETNMLLMSPMTDGKPHTIGLHQLDIETGKIVSEWRFGKDETDVTMRDITNDTQGAQMDPSGSTFWGLDDNRLCRWDMRSKRGMVQNLASSSASCIEMDSRALFL